MIPAGAALFAFAAAPPGPVPAQEVQRQAAYGRQVLGRMPRPRPALVLAHLHARYPIANLSPCFVFVSRSS